MLKPLFREIRSGCPEELLYADDLTLASETLEGLKGRAWKFGKEHWSQMG